MVLAICTNVGKMSGYTSSLTVTMPAAYLPRIPCSARYLVIGASRAVLQKTLATLQVENAQGKGRRYRGSGNAHRGLCGRPRR